jgi:hypothetical protein
VSDPINPKKSCLTPLTPNLVTHIELKNGVVNLTTMMHGLDGVVFRVAIPTEAGVVIRSEGYGVGNLSNQNTNALSQVWNLVDTRIRNSFSSAAVPKVKQ